MAESTLRIIPGAPPPAPASKSQKKKRKGKGKSGEDSPALEVNAALAEDKATDGADTLESSAVPEIPFEEPILKPSPIVELINKRLKATNKKIV